MPPRFDTPKLKRLATDLLRIETASDQILTELGRRKPLLADDQIDPARFTVKKASAAVISSPDDIELHAGDPSDVSLAMQIRRDLRDATTLNTLENPGGAWLSVEELAELRRRGIDPMQAPGNLFYEMTGQEFLRTGRMPQFTYDMQAGFGPVVARNVGMELTQEMGKRAASAVTLGEVLNPDDPKCTDLTTINFGDAVNREVAAKYGVPLTPDGKSLKGIVTWVEEYAVGASADIDQLLALSQVTEEANGLVRVTIGELVESGKRATENTDAWENYNQLHGQLRPRAPSTFWQVRMQIEAWLRGATL